MTDQDFLDKAISLAGQSPEPVGCGVIIVQDGNILAETYNSQRADNIAVYHAEIKAIIAANQEVNSRKLDNATAYCSCEPCAMCLTALSYAKVKRIIFHKRMIDLFPDDPQSQFDAHAYVQGLNFVPVFEQPGAIEPPALSR
jgi:guanine deaminase